MIKDLKYDVRRLNGSRIEDRQGHLWSITRHQIVAFSQMTLSSAQNPSRQGFHKRSVHKHVKRDPKNWAHLQFYFELQADGRCFRDFCGFSVVAHVSFAFAIKN